MSAHVDSLKGDTPHPASSVAEKQTARQHWLDLADEQEHGATLGLIHPKVAAHNASLYRRTARSIEIEIETGQAVCVCCFKPFGRGALQH
ncbi:hypothetical protein ACM7I9_09435 [Pseudomonas aeruginosa]|nr:hypothetical protein [Pseudomonas aeruginosa]